MWPFDSDLISNRVCVQRASRSRWSRSPVRMVCSPLSIIPTVLGNTQSPSPGGVSTSRRGELFSVCFVCVLFKELPNLIWMVKSAEEWSVLVWPSCSLCHFSVERIECFVGQVLGSSPNFWSVSQMRRELWDYWGGKTHWWVAKLGQTRHESEDLHVKEIPVLN